MRKHIPKWSDSTYESLSHSCGKDRSFRRRSHNSFLLHRLHFCEVKSLLKVLLYCYDANLISDIFHAPNSYKESLILGFMAVKKDGEILPTLVRFVTNVVNTRTSMRISRHTPPLTWHTALQAMRGWGRVYGWHTWLAVAFNIGGCCIVVEMVYTDWGLCRWSQCACRPDVKP